MNAPFHPKIGQNDAFSAFLGDAESQDSARTAAIALGWPADRIQTGGIKYAVETLAITASPNVLLVDLSDSPEPMVDMDSLAEVCEPGTLVIACGAANDIQLYRTLLASGVHDYLVKPFTPAQLTEAIMAAQVQEADQRERERAAVKGVEHVMLAVIGVRGGSGASTIAVSTAWALAESRGRHTALLDLDVHWGTGAMALDLDPGRGLTDAIENPNRIDGLFIERALVRAHEKLGVLSAEAPIHSPVQGDGTAFLYLQDELRNAFGSTVIDLPRHMLIQHPPLMESVNVAIVVTELTLAATRDTIRLLAWLKSNAPKTRIILVANKVQTGVAEEIGRKDFETSIERAIDILVPYDSKTATQAAKLGKAFLDVAKGTKTGQAIEAIVPLLLNEEAARPANRSLLDHFGNLATLLKKPTPPTP